MSNFTVAQVIEQARDLDGSFSPLTHPNKTVISFLQRYQRELLARTAAFDSGLETAQVTLTLPLGDFAAGESLTVTDYVRIVHVEIQRKGNTEDWFDFNLIDISDRLRFGIPAGWIRQGNLYLVGRAAQWTDFTNIRITYVPDPGALTGTSTFAFDDLSENCLVMAAAAFMAKRIPGALTATLAALISEFKAAERFYLETIKHREGATVTVVPETY